MNFDLLDWDTQYFGAPVARIVADILDVHQLAELLTELKRQRVHLVYWASASRCDDEVIQEHGGMLADLRITYAMALTAGVIQEMAHAPLVEPFSPSMPMDDLRGLAIQSGEHSRFATDSRISRAQFEGVFVSWLNGCVTGDYAREILVVREAERVAGMVTLGEKDGRGDIGLIAVDHAYRGRKYGEHLVRAAQRWSFEHGFAEAQVITHGRSVAACKLYEKCGYTIEKVEHFYHFWLQPPAGHTPKG
jgi:dTDP-4-amino-4,6-dideoxy-D-galactose acyltransferase